METITLGNPGSIALDRTLTAHCKQGKILCDVKFIRWYSHFDPRVMMIIVPFPVYFCTTSRSPASLSSSNAH